MSRFTFELAAPADGQELLEILEDAPFTGNLSLLYTRRPDAYQSFMREGPHVDIVVCRDQDRGAIVGFGACALRQVFVNGMPQTVGYLFGLRVRQEYMRKFPLLHKGYALIPDLHRQLRIPFYLTTILADNYYAQRVLEKRRASMPAYLPYGAYTVYTVFQRKTARLPDLRPWYVRQAHRHDGHRLVNFISEQGRTMQFFPVIQEPELLSGQWPGLGIENFYLLCDEHDGIQAAGAIWDQARYKQYILQRYGGIFAVLAPLSRLFPLVGWPALPMPGNPVRFFTLAFFAVKENNPAFSTDFFRQWPISAEHIRFFLVGLHERNPLGQVVGQRPHIRYASRLYLVSWNAEPPILETLNSACVPYRECGLL